MVKKEKQKQDKKKESEEKKQKYLASALRINLLRRKKTVQNTKFKL